MRLTGRSSPGTPPAPCLDHPARELPQPAAAAFHQEELVASAKTPGPSRGPSGRMSTKAMAPRSFCWGVGVWGTPPNNKVQKGSKPLEVWLDRRDMLAVGQGIPASGLYTSWVMLRRMSSVQTNVAPRKVYPKGSIESVLIALSPKTNRPKPRKPSDKGARNKPTSRRADSQFMGELPMNLSKPMVA